jgi:hypothetical protein
MSFEVNVKTAHSSIDLSLCAISFFLFLSYSSIIKAKKYFISEIFHPRQFRHNHNLQWQPTSYAATGCASTHSAHAISPSTPAHTPQQPSMPAVSTKAPGTNCQRIRSTRRKKKFFVPLCWLICCGRPIPLSHNCFMRKEV